MPDLKSRLSAAPNIRIHAPDETLIAAVMVKMFADQMDVGADVLAYRQPDGPVIRGGAVLVTRLNNASLAAKRGITVPLARDVLKTPESFVQKIEEACQVRFQVIFEAAVQCAAADIVRPPRRARSRSLRP